MGLCLKRQQVYILLCTAVIVFTHLLKKGQLSSEITLYALD